MTIQTMCSSSRDSLISFLSVIPNIFSGYLQFMEDKVEAVWLASPERGCSYDESEIANSYESRFLTFYIVFAAVFVALNMAHSGLLFGVFFAAAALLSVWYVNNGGEYGSVLFHFLCAVLMGTFRVLEADLYSMNMADLSFVTWFFLPNFLAYLLVKNSNGK